MAAPLGNTNALKHGLYAAAFTEAQKEAAEAYLQGDLTAEIDVLRVNLAHFGEARLMRCQNNCAPNLHVSVDMLNTAASFAARLNGLILANRSPRLGHLRNRGAQPGNLNAFRRGLYTARFTPEEIAALQSLVQTDVRAEIAFLRTLVEDVSRLMGTSIFETQEHLRGMRAISFACSVIKQLMFTQSLFNPGGTLNAPDPSPTVDQEIAHARQVVQSVNLKLKDLARPSSIPHPPVSEPPRSVLSAASAQSAWRQLEFDFSSTTTASQIPSSSPKKDCSSFVSPRKASRKRHASSPRPPIPPHRPPN